MSNGMIEKIRKLLAKASDPSITDEESMSFAAKARQLMIEYEISPEAVGDHDRSNEYVLHEVRVEGFAVWKAMVRQAAAQLYFCEFLLDGDDPASAQAFFLFGHGRHLEAAESFGAYLESAIMRKGAAYPNRDEKFFTSFRNQCAHVVAQRVKALIAKEKAPMVPGGNLPVPVSMALALTDALQAAMGEGGTGVVKAKAEVNDALGLALGAQAGREIALNRQLAGGPSDAPALPEKS